MVGTARDVLSCSSLDGFQSMFFVHDFRQISWSLFGSFRLSTGFFPDRDFPICPRPGPKTVKVKTFLGEADFALIERLASKNQRDIDLPLVSKLMGYRGAGHVVVPWASNLVALV